MSYSFLLGLKTLAKPFSTNLYKKATNPGDPMRTPMDDYYSMMNARTADNQPLSSFKTEAPKAPMYTPAPGQVGLPRGYLKRQQTEPAEQTAGKIMGPPLSLVGHAADTFTKYHTWPYWATRFLVNSTSGKELMPDFLDPVFNTVPRIVLNTGYGTDTADKIDKTIGFGTLLAAGAQGGKDLARMTTPAAGRAAASTSKATPKTLNNGAYFTSFMPDIWQPAPAR